MTSEYPPELKGFHRRNFFQVFVVFMVPVVAGGWALYRQEAFGAEDDLQSILHWIFMIGVGLFVMTVLVKALVSVPKCPKCGQKMKQKGTVIVTQETVFKFRASERWRIVHCSRCDMSFRVPGLSTE